MFTAVSHNLILHAYCALGSFSLLHSLAGQSSANTISTKSIFLLLFPCCCWSSLNLFFSHSKAHKSRHSQTSAKPSSVPPYQWISAGLRWKAAPWDSLWLSTIPWTKPGLKFCSMNELWKRRGASASWVIGTTPLKQCDGIFACE